MTRVAHVIAPINFGGGESLLINLLKEINPDYSEIVISIYKSEKLNEALDEIGVRHWELTDKSLGDGVSKAKIGLDTLGIILKLPVLVRILRKQKIDIIHAHGYPSSVLFGFLGMFGFRRGIYTHHSYRKKPGYIEHKILGYYYNKFEYCTAVSRVAAESMRQAFPVAGEKFITVYNCVSNSFFTTKQKNINYEKKENKIRFIQIGRFIMLKNHRLVVEALAKLASEDLERIEISFAGEGSELPYIKKLAISLGVSDSVKFLGAVPHEKLPGVLEKFDYGLFPSDIEGFGIGAVECLAAGLPVLALKNELMEEIVGDAGILVDKSGLANGLIEMMREGDKIRERTRLKAVRYLPKEVKNDYCKIYKRLK